MNLKKALPFIAIIILAIISIGVRKCRSTATTTPATSKGTKANTQNSGYTARGLNRNPSHINYSKHARCRMECRHITEREIAEILKNGTVNYKKSELSGDECHKKYAVEGYSQDKQHLRLIFAPCNDEVTVVTCIDLETEWTCECETGK